MDILMSKSIEGCALWWLETSGTLENVFKEMRRRSQLTNPKSVVRLIVPVDCTEIHHHNQELANMIVWQPLEAEKLFKSLVHIACVSCALHFRNEGQDENNNCPEYSDRNEGQNLCANEQIRTDLNDVQNTLDMLRRNGYRMMALDSSYSVSSDGEQERVNIFGLNSASKLSGLKKNISLLCEKEDLNCTLLSLATDVPMEKEDDIVTAAQVMIRLRVTGMPLFSPWLVCHLKNLEVYGNSHRLAVLQGHVISVTQPKNYTIWARYQCTNSDCVAHHRKLHIRVYSHGKVEAQTVTCDQRCRICCNLLKEVHSSREIGQKIIVKILPKIEKPTKVQRMMLKTIDVTMRDEDSQLTVLGAFVSVTVLSIPNHPPQYPHLEALSVETMNTDRALHTVPVLSREESSKINSVDDFLHASLCRDLPLRLPLPAVISDLYEDRRDSPWSVSLTLAYMVGSSICPPGTFHRLKLALLLSLVSAHTNKHPGLSVLSVCSDTSTQQKLLAHLAPAAPNVVEHCCRSPLFIGKHGEKDWYDAGSLVSSADGVCLMGDLSTYRKDTIDSLRRVLESNTCSSESIEVPLKCRLWCYFDPAKKKHRVAPMAPQTSIGHVPKALTDLFGIVVYSDSLSGDIEQSTAVMSAHILCNAVEGVSPGDLLSVDHLKQLVEVCRNIRVNFSASAHALLRGYYVACRSLCSAAAMGNTLPITSITNLALVSECHARLSLRATVTESDATAAILMWEETLQVTTGFSVLQVSYQPHMPQGVPLNVTLGRQNDEYMSNLLCQLQRLVSEMNT